jgi:hypothetical protein
MTQTSTEHPILGFARALEQGLDKVAGCEPVFMATTDKAEALTVLHRQEQRLVGLRIRVLAAADDVAEVEGARDAAAWLAQHTRTERGPNTADLELGRALERRWTRLGAAMVAGGVNLAQTRVIAHALDDLPAADVPDEVLVAAEEHLVEQAAYYGPHQLAVLGRKILEVVAPELYDAQEAAQLDKEEQRAQETTSLFTKRLGDGCTRITAKVPDTVADRLATYLDALTSPRHQGICGVQDGDQIPAARKRGQAFAVLLEAFDPQRMPLHGGDATTVIITLSLADLQTRLAAAGVISTAEGPISAAEARRLACTATLIPAVLGGDGQILDLGRAARLFSRAQRKALRLRDRHCRADGCTVPAGWCDAHHQRPWSTGGPTDLANAVLLCNWHHHRAHDDRYLHQQLPNGDLRYTRRN